MLLRYAALVLVAAAALAVSAAPPNDPWAAILLQHDINPTAKGISEHLLSLKPNEATRARIAELLRRLSSEKFTEREEATKQLVKLPILPADLIDDAVNGDDPEIAGRVRRITVARASGGVSASIAVACFRSIQTRKLMGLTPAVLEALPLYTEQHVLNAGREALKITSRPEDLPLLRDTIKSGVPEARVAAIGALAFIMKDQAAGELSDLLSDSEPRVKLAAARALGDRGDRACLAPLIELLSAPDQRVRQGAISALRGLTGRNSDYVAWSHPDGQKSAIAAWQTWLEKESKNARLTYPLRPTDYELGRTLICLYAKNMIVEYDDQGRETFNVAEPNACPWACQGLSSGSRLVALYTSNMLVEYGPDGKERSRLTVGGGPMSVQRLDNGNTLLACNNAGKVMEIDPQGKTVWELALNGGPCDAQRLENGHTLVTLQNNNTVVEIDSTGKEHAKIEGLQTPRTAVRLDTGNTLVCDLGRGRVVEFDNTGKEVWNHAGLSSPFGAQRLSNGNTLVSDTQGVKEIDPSGKVVNDKRMDSLGRVSRY